MNEDFFDLSDKVAVITGGGRGIGFAIAKEFGRRGATVAIVGRNNQTLEHAATEMSSTGINVSTHPADMAKPDAIEALKNDVISTHSQIDILVNNAGVSPVYASIEKTTKDDWDFITSVNLSGVFHSCRVFGKAMLAKGGGSIVNISSIAGHVGLEKQAAYCATKGGVEQMTKAMALDWAHKGIRVNAVAYGFISTDLTEGIRGHDKLSENLLSRTPMRRFGALNEVTGAVVFLASEAASFVTGTSLLVDGGWTAR